MTHAAADPSVETSVELDASIDAVRDALSDPELLSAWLGSWTEDSSGATVVTDDGVLRRVTDHLVSPDSVSWRWQEGHDDDGPASRVTIELEQIEGATRLTVRETCSAARTSSGERAGAPRPARTPGRLALDSAAWLASLLALGAVLAASSLVRV